jgi:hypothetical protein
VLRVLEPALRMKAQTLIAEIRKILFVENTGDPVVQGGEWLS